MNVFLENIKKSDQQTQVQTLQSITEVLDNYVESDKIFSYTTEDQINTFFKTDLLRFTNLYINTFPKDFNDLPNKENVFFLMESYLAILNKNVFSICLAFSTLIIGLKKLENFEDSFFTNILSVDLLMNLTESFNSEPMIDLLDFILLTSSCIDSEESQIDNTVMFGEISEATITLFKETNFNKFDSAVISRIFTNIINLFSDFSNSDSETLDDSFYICFFNSLVKILQCESFEKQNFAINCLEKMLINHNNLFFQWAMSVNPFITLNNIEGIDQIITEISRLIQKISEYRIIKIDQETLEKFITRIDNADLSQKKTFMNNFGIVASNSDEQIVLKVIEKYIGSHKLTSNLCSFLGSCAIFTLTTKPTVSQYIINYLENKLSEYFETNNDNTIISVLENIYKASPTDLTRMKFYCSSYLNDKMQKIPLFIYELMLSIFQNLEPNEASQILDKMIIYNDENEPLFDKLLAQIVLRCEIPLNSNQSVYVLDKLTENEEKLEILFEIMKKRGTNIISIESWIAEIQKIVKKRPIEISLKFTNKVLPNFYYLPYQTYSKFFVVILLILVQRYLKEEDEMIRDQIFECYYTHMIMCNMSVRVSFLKNYVNSYVQFFTTDNYQYLTRICDLLYKSIIRSEYYIDPLLFDINRHRPIKKEKGGFDLSLSRIKPELVIHVYPTTKVRDLLFTIGLYNCYSNLFDFSLKKVSDQTILDNDTTLEDNNINESTELELFHNSPSTLYAPTPVLFTLIIGVTCSNALNFVMNILFSESISEKMLIDEEFNTFLKSIWKICKILPSLENVKLRMKDKDFLCNILLNSTNRYQKLYYIQEIANKAKQDPSYLTFLSTSNLISNIAKLIFNPRIDEKIRIEIMKILIYYSRNTIDLSYFDPVDMQNIVPTLTNYFIISRKIKSRKLILELLNLVFTAKTQSDFCIKFSPYVIENDQFFKICIFTAESLIVHSLKLFKTLSSLFGNVLFKKFASFFDSVIKDDTNSLIQNEDYFQLFGAIIQYTDSSCANEVDGIFQKCVQKLHDFKYKWLNSIAELVSIFMSKMHKELDDDSILNLINFVFEGNEGIENSSIFSILRQVFTDSSDTSLYSFIIEEHVEKFKTDRWNYSPSIHKKREQYCGLRNLGSTCYMNSILQLLENNSNFFNRVFSLENPTPIVVQIRELFAYLECSILNYANTEKFANHWGEKEYTAFEPRYQEDAAEFLHILLDKLPEELKELFSGNLINSFNGITVDFHHEIPERFYTLEIPIGLDFFESMRSIIKPQMFIGNNQYMSEEKGKIDVERKTKIVQFPRNLVIQLKRFDFNVKEGRRTKINDEFIFPMSFNTKECFPGIDESQSFDYVLTGVITHSGTADGGHYNSILRKINDENEDEFICFNDSEVSRISKEKFWSMSKGDSYSQVAAYLLFYEWNDETFKSQQYEDKKLKIDSNLQQLVMNENQKIQQTQSLFNDSMGRFIIDISEPSILIKYFTHVLCHSSLTSLAKPFSTAIINKIQDDANLIAENIDSEYIEIFDALVNSPDEIVNSIIDILSYVYRLESKNINMELMNNISSKIVSHLNTCVSAWRVYERFGKIVEVICSSHLEIAIKYNYFDSIVSLISEFYNITTGVVAIENINLSPFINGLNILIDSVTSRESLDKLVNIIDLYGMKISPHQSSFRILISNGIQKNKIPDRFIEYASAPAKPTIEVATKENIVDIFMNCETNRDFISFLSTLKNSIPIQEFFEIANATDPYLLGRTMQKIPVFNVFLICYSPFIDSNKQQSFNVILQFLEAEFQKEAYNDYNFDKKTNKTNQLGSEVQETISTMINLFNYSFLLYAENHNIFYYFIHIFMYAADINTPKSEHFAWINNYFDDSFKISQQTAFYALDVCKVILSYLDQETVSMFLSTKFDTIVDNLMNNWKFTHYFDFVAAYYSLFKDSFQILPDLFMKLISPGQNLLTFNHILKNIKNNGKIKNRDIFLESLKVILSSIAELNNDYAIRILQVLKDVIDVVFKESRLFYVIDKLADVIDEQSAILFIKKLLENSEEIVTKMKVVSTLNTMTKIVQKISSFKEDIDLLNLTPRYLVFFNANKDQIPIVIDFAKLLAEKCHPLGNALFDHIFEFATIPENRFLNISKWGLLATVLGICYDPDRAKLIANHIIQISKSENIDTLFKDEAVIDCICKLKDFVNNDEDWPDRLISLIMSSSSVLDYTDFISAVINIMSKEKLEHFAENIAYNMNPKEIFQFMNCISLLLILKSDTNFDMKSFVDKHKDIFMNEWPPNAEKYRYNFVDI